MIVTAWIQTKPSPARDAPPVERREVSVEAADYESAKREMIDRLPDGWQVSSWRVRTDPDDNGPGPRSDLSES